MNQKKGITLVALVITVVVLLILAGVAIATLTGSNGIINKSNAAATKYTNANKTETNSLTEMDNILEQYNTTYNPANPAN